MALSIDDFTRKDNGRYSVRVRRAKSDPEGAGRTSHLSTRTGQFVDEWLLAIGNNTGPVLRPVCRTKALALYLEPVMVSRVLKKLATLAATPPQIGRSVSGHSLRVWAAQQLVLDGRRILKIIRVGCRRSTNVVAAMLRMRVLVCGINAVGV